MSVTRVGGEWVATYVGNDGKRREAPDIAIPSCVEEDEIARVLANLFHESASPDFPDVVSLGRSPSKEPLELREESATNLGPYSAVPMAFTSDRILVPAPDLGPLAFREQAHTPPFTKDYDSEPGHHPTEWPTRFDTSTWTVLSAWRGSSRVGGAVLIHSSSEIDMLEGRGDLAVLWDLRVHPEARGDGVGSFLVEAAASWARQRGCSQLKVETQNINLAACRFYENAGFRVGSVDPDAYPDLPNEIQILWYMDL